MIDLDAAYLSEEHRMLRQQLRRFIETEVRPAAPAWEEAGRIPPDVFRRMGELGFLGLSMPAELGGAGFDTLGSVVFGEELGRSGFGGFGAAVTDHADIAAPVLRRNGTAEQKARYLPDVIAGRRLMGLGVTEPGGGSDLVAMKTVARRDGDHYILNGQKTFITNALSADLFVTVARTDPEAKGAAGFSLFLVEKGTPGFSIGAGFRKTGWLCSDMSDLFFDDCSLPAENLLGPEHRGFYLMMQGIEHERLSIGSQCIGLAERAVEITLRWLKERPAYRRTLWDLQAVRHEMAAISADLAAAKLLVYHAAARKSRGEDARLESTMVKALAPERLKAAVDRCVQLHGGLGYMREAEIERIWRDTRPHSLGGGASHVMLDEIAKLL
ncbi:acyl-CoA dehydrogenase family protein [Zavarzinia compransoris]|uniref:Medium-chain specific acyl-CoA dehydrogenase, mitochondrial n=1 Tax=Zavarzinia compransoris TaxID=1264899 RepID=A0A317E5X3_9PROT|nr:acyl-CoA dehydrogenase family protein [Zavarzinia compransoris]PWR22012.1 acyl-CoA dehydrogenase [Zavarzinia compransoris]TDP47249.1 acyl-CoA dehydrogenase [Zavarzinia compransoris]